MNNSLKNLDIGRSQIRVFDNTEAIQKDIFEVVNYLHNLRVLELPETNLISFPKNSFKIEKLELINLGFNQIKTIESNIISNLPFLQTLRLNGNPIKEIKAFAFASELDTPLTITLGTLFKNEVAMALLAFAGIERPATLILGDVDRFNQTVFSHYFLSHESHLIQLNQYDRNLTCDCETYWLWYKKESFKERFVVEEEIEEDYNKLWCDGFDVEIWDLKEKDFGECSFTSNAFEIKYHEVDGKKYKYL